MSERVHFIGIGGTGLSAIARVLHERGRSVTGSDLKPSAYSSALERDGVVVHYGHDPEHVTGADLVVVSSAVPPDNPEVAAAKQAGIKVVRRAEFLPELTAGLEVVAVAGTHGKTTTSALIAWILHKAGRDPGFIVGSELKNFDTNAAAGSGSTFVIEADEYDRTFLGLRPDVAVITNVEHDHPDMFHTEADFRQAFEAFVQQVEGKLVVFHEDPVALEISGSHPNVVSYGLAPGAGWRAEDIRTNQAGGSDFLVAKHDEVLGLVRTRLPGTHNIHNTLAGLAVANELKVGFSLAREAVTTFLGTARRFEIVGEAADVTVVDDYAHHPTEIRATLQAARQRFGDRPIWAVFQPHTYTRTRAFLSQIAEAFGGADHVLVTPVFAAREEPDSSMRAGRLAAEIDHQDVRSAESLEEAERILFAEVRPGDVVITLSAGDGNWVGQRLLQRLAVREGGRIDV